MASTGWVLAGTGTNVVDAGQAWTDPGNITLDDGSLAQSASLSDSKHSDYLQATNFSFGITAGSTITGVSVRIKREAGASPGICDYLVQIIKGGTKQGNNNADAATSWPLVLTNADYGGASNLWGLTLSDTDVSASNFGVAIQATGNAGSSLNTGFIDAVWINIEYTPGGPSNTGQGGAYQPLYPALFAKKFPVKEQQYDAQPRAAVAASPSNSAQMGALQPLYPSVVIKPFAAKLQQYDAQGRPGSVPTAASPQGWQGIQLETRRIPPRKVWQYPYNSYQPQDRPPTFYLNDSRGYQFEYRFKKPFPASAQQYSGFTPLGDVPIFVPPPGSGKRKDFPSYIAQPAYEVKPNPPFQPVWDKRRQIERDALARANEPAPEPIGPPPLPPASIFAQPPAQPVAPPRDFSEFVPADPTGLAKGMQEARDKSDALAVLRQLGLIP